MGRLDGKVAIITGAAGGMGLAAAQLFAREGAKVVATDIQLELMEKEVANIAANGGDAIAVKLDVANEEDWQKAVEAAAAQYGKIDILINNAGYGTVGNILASTAAGWAKVLSINVTGVGLGIKAVIPHMQKNKGGSIINTSSTSALRPEITISAEYCASKGAVHALTKHIAAEYAKDQIRVNTVYPGAIFTPMVEAVGIPSQEVYSEGMKEKAPLPPHAGLPMDIAYAYLFLASDESKFITGVGIPVDAGMTL